MADESINFNSTSNTYDIGSSALNFTFSFPKYCDQLIFEIQLGETKESSLAFMCDQEPDHLGECTFTMTIGDTKIHFERDNSEIPDDDEDFEELEEIHDVLDELDDLKLNEKAVAEILKEFEYDCDDEEGDVNDD